MAKEHPTPYAYSRISAWASFPDISADMVDIANLSIRYGENSIPSAVCSMSMGLDPRTGKPSGAHRYASSLEKRMKILIWLKIDGEELPGRKWPVDAFKIFEGYISGVGYAQSRGALNLTVSAEHWLADLKASSKYSAYLVSSSPGNLLQRVTPEGTIWDKGKWDVAFDISMQDVIYDVWGNGLKPMFTKLASSDRMDIDALIRILPAPPELLSNEKALAAVNRFDTGIDSKVLQIRGAAGGTQEEADLAAVLNMWVAISLGDLVSDPSMGATFWDVLMQVATQFQFTVIPNVEGVTCAPHVRQLASTYAYIKASEYTQAEITGRTPISLRALGLSGGFPAGDFRQSKEARPYVEAERPQFKKPPVPIKPATWFAGYFDLAAVNDDIAKVRPDILQGQFMVMNAPGWMQLLNTQDNVIETLPVGGKKFRSVMNPGIEKEEPPDDGFNKKLSTVLSSGVGDKLAQVLFLNLCYGSRTGTLPGRLRFDIAPGSSVAVEIVGEKVPFYRGKKLYANVTEVTCSIDAVVGQAGTIFRLTNMRTDAEQKELEGLAVESNPLYTETWIGTYLAAGFQPSHTED